MANFIPLRIISGYSFLRSGLNIPKIIESVKKKDYPAAGLADFNVLFGVPEFIKQMEKIKKPFIVGASFFFEDEYVCYVLNEEGYRNIINISSLEEEGKLDYEYFLNHLKGIAVILETKCGEFKEKAIEKNDTGYLKKLAKLSTFCDIFYLGLEVTNKDEFAYANKVREFASNHSYKCIAFPRIQYQKKEDALILTMVNAIEKDLKIDVKKEEGPSYFMDEKDYHKIYKSEEIDATNELVKLNNFKFDIKRGELLHYPVADSKKSLENKCLIVLKKLGKDDERHLKRLKHELGVILELGYEDYFLIVADYVNYAKKQGILVGPGRGSSAGSLVAYLLNITEVDPLDFDLSFERFLNKARKTMPDIDVDFMDTRRDEMVQYVREKYGAEKVSNIITFQTIQAKQSLRDVGRIYDYPTRHIDLLCKSITDQISLREAYKKLEAFRQLVDSDPYFLEIVSLASKIENLPRQHGVHPAGVVLNDKPIKDVLPISLDINENYISQYESEYLEEQGFLKMDFLSLRTLTTIDICLKLIKKNHEKDLSFYDIPYDDKEAINTIRKGDTAGLFQIESSGMKQAIKILQPSAFSDVVALIALFRPGPQDNIKDYALRKEGKKKVTCLSEDVKKILESTYGVLIYQEQISALATSMANYSPTDADLFRKAVSKKEKALLESSEKDFINGSVKKGYEYKVAKKMFDDIVKFANYGFNKSHAVVYAITATRMAYLKYHYPLEFYVALLTTSSGVGDAKFSLYLSELKKRNLKIYNPDINESGLLFNVKEDGLLLPLNYVKGISNLIASKIVDERMLNGPFTDFFSFTKRMFTQGINEGILTKLVNAGAFDNLHQSRSTLRATVKYALQFAELSYGSDGQMILDDTLENQKNYFVEKDDPLENLNLEYEALGLMISDSPLKYKKDILRKLHAVSLTEAKESNGDVTTAGIISAIKIIKTRKKGESMAFIKLFDETDEMEITIFPSLFAKSIQKLEKNNIIYVIGHYDRHESEKESFVAEKIENLEE